MEYPRVSMRLGAAGLLVMLALSDVALAQGQAPMPTPLEEALGQTINTLLGHLVQAQADLIVAKHKISGLEADLAVEKAKAKEGSKK